MEPLQPDTRWQLDRISDQLPEAKLIQEIIKLAWRDSKLPSCRQDKARRWFYSSQFEEYCQLLNLNADLIRDEITASWKSTKSIVRYKRKNY